jgi:lipopolysaccharide/colanic/teichoic acid biosynthesis glycosyltransferase
VVSEPERSGNRSETTTTPARLISSFPQTWGRECGGAGGSGAGGPLPPAGCPRWFDLLAAAFGLSVLAPFLALIWLLIRLDSPGGALFRQARVGLCGRLFTCYKFRSMRVGVAKPAPRIADFGAYVFNPVRRSDPRLTRIGAALRRTSVDELPQLLNVLRGEMKIVGPRPELPEIVAQYPREFRKRHDVPPGITGLAQIKGRSNLTYLRGVAYDLVYVERRSPALDVAILLRTFAAVVRGIGAR